MSRPFNIFTTTITAIFLAAAPCLSEPWMVLSAAHIPEGATALTFGFGQLWCGYEVEGDSVLRVINPEDGSTQAEHIPPQAAQQENLRP